MTHNKAIVIPIRAQEFREPTLEEILADPITKAVMQADAVDIGLFKDMLRRIGHGRR